MALSVTYAQVSDWFVSTTPKSIASLAWSTGDRIYVIGRIETNDASITLATPTNANLSFSLLTSQTGSGSTDTEIYLWEAVAGSSQTGQTIQGTMSAGTAIWGFDVTIVSGGPSGTANVSSDRTEAAPSLTVSAGSVVINGYADFAAVAAGRTQTTGSGTASERVDTSDGTHYGIWGGDWVDTAAGTFSFGVSSYTGTTISQVWVEVLAPAASVEQEGYRWRNDDGDEDGATWRQSQDTVDEAELDETVRLRVLLNATSDPASTQYQLEYVEDGGTDWRAIGIGAIGTTTPTKVGWGSAALSTNDPSVNLSSGSWTPAENDIVLFFISSTTVLAVAGAAGWVNPLGGTTSVNSDAHGYCAGYHIVTAGEVGGGTTFTATDYLSAAETGNVIAVAIRGVDPADVVISAGSTFNSGNTTTPHVLAALTGANQPDRTGGLIVRGVSKDGTGTYTDPAGHTIVTSSNTNNGHWVGTRDAATTAASDVAAVNITPSAGDEYCSITIAFTPARVATPAVTHATSTNFADGDATTAQLTAPSGKTTSDFDAGVMVEGQALADAVNITSDDYTEIEWALKIQSPAEIDDVFDFRVTAAGTPITPYTVTPSITVSSGAITGSGAATQANQTAAGTGHMRPSGSAAVTQANQTAAGSGTHTLTITGSAAPTQANQTASGTGTHTQTITGSAAVTQANQTASGAGVLTATGSAAVTQADQIASGAGTHTQTITGSAAVTQADQTAAGTGTHTYTITGSGTSVQVDQTATGVGTHTQTITGSATVTQENQTATGSGTHTQTITGTGSSTQDSQTVSGSGTHTYTITGTGVSIQDDQTAVGSGYLQPTGTGAAVQDEQTAIGSGTHGLTITGSGASTQADQTASGSGIHTQTVTGTGTSTQADQTVTGSGTHTYTITGAGAATQADQVATGAGSHTQTVIGSGATTQDDQVAAGSGTETFSGSGIATQADQVANGVGTHTYTIAGSGASTQDDQVAAGNGSVGSSPTSAGAATQENQVAAGTGTVTYTMTGVGAAVQADQTAVGAGTHTYTITGSGTAVQADQTANGVGLEYVVGTGASTQADQAALGSGTATTVITGAGTTTQQNQTASGIGTVTFGPSTGGTVELVLSNAGISLTLGSPDLRLTLESASIVLTVEG